MITQTLTTNPITPIVNEQKIYIVCRKKVCFFYPIPPLAPKKLNIAYLFLQ